MGSRSYGFWLWVLLGLFSFRVVAQFVQWRMEVPFLPSFEAWHSAVIPYELLLAAQILVLGFYGWVALAFWKGNVRASRKSARVWLSIGGMYATVMVMRLVLGLTVMSSHYWFANYLPTFFHLVLAGFMLVVGLFHLRHTASPPVMER